MFSDSGRDTSWINKLIGIRKGLDEDKNFWQTNEFALVRAKFLDMLIEYSSF
jgi:hypothetical protein